MEILKTEVVDRQRTNKSRETYAVLTVRSLTNPAREYRVDLTNRRCSCPAWKFQKGDRRPCKHLRQLGVKDEPVLVNTQTAEQLNLQYESQL